MTIKVNFEEVDPLPEPEPPPEGWHEPSCTWESHKWTLVLEDGRFSINCVDPCNPEVFDPAKAMPFCQYAQEWEREDFHTPEPIPVRIKFVDDSTPSGPWGPAEYGFYIEVYHA